MTLTASGLHLWRGERHVLRGTSFTLATGEALHVCGPNGAGKTTLLRAVCGLTRPEEGTVTWNGVNIHKEPDPLLADLAYLGHDTALKGDLTARENLRFAIGLRTELDEARLSSTLAELGLEDCADLPARVLSAGQRRRVALARILLSGARLWVLDEPFTNLDTNSSRHVARLLSSHVASGGLALIAAHQDPQLGVSAVARLELT